MFEKIMNLIKEAISKMTDIASKPTDLAGKYEINTISTEMAESIDLWKDMYKDEPDWVDESEGVYSIGIPKLACQLMTMIMLNEMDLKVVPEGYDKQKGDKVDENSLAGFIQKDLDEHLLGELDEMVEKALALGGCIIKPYISNNQIYYDFIPQGDFYPIAFDDDGNITDIAFLDQFTQGEFIYSRVERQTFIFSEKKVIVENKAFRAKLVNSDEDNKNVELGQEIELTDIKKWENITPYFEITSVDKPLYGYYKVASANNIDMKTPLGISFFAPAAYICYKIDEQFCRLDWEYDGGQLAIDVDPTALEESQPARRGYWNSKNTLEDLRKKAKDISRGKNRIFRTIDRGQDDTYEPYNPTLRDSSYLAGLNRYLTLAEDKMGLARGSLAIEVIEAKTATELKILQQRAYRTAKKNQDNLKKCLENVIDAANAYIDLYRSNKDKKSDVDLSAPEGNYEIILDFGDSVLTDKDTELAIKIQLLDKSVLSKAEVRAAYTGEPLDIAQQQIDSIREENQQNMLPDLFSGMPEATLENQEPKNKKDGSKDDKDNKKPADNQQAKKEGPGAGNIPTTSKKGEQ